MLEIWLEFEESKTPTAQFAKSMDRFQAPNQNLISGGGTWIEYKVKFNQVEKRVGSKISIGAPKLWNWLKPRLKAFLDS
jgi:putative hydrolase of HD superfamily